MPDVPDVPEEPAGPTNCTAEEPTLVELATRDPVLIVTLLSESAVLTVIFCWAIF